MKKIVLVDGSNSLRDTIENAIRSEDSLEISENYESISELTARLDGNGLDASWLLVLRADEPALQFAQGMIPEMSGGKVMNISANGGNFSINWQERKISKEITLEDLIRILQAED
jgi:hypothetical protein